MIGQFYVGAYWGERRESAGACAQRLQACLGALAELDGALSGWRPKGSRPTAEFPSVGTDLASLESLVASGRNRRDVGKGVIEELGFGVALWNGDSRRSIGLRMTCGAFAGPRVANVFTLQLPDDDLCSWMPWPKARRLMEIMVTYFDPQWATLSSHEWREAQRSDPGVPVVGWLTYLTDAPAPKLPSGAAVERLAGGLLISTGEDCDDTLGQRVLRVAEALR
ncbi:MAG: immunity 52 family protein [Nocardioidaceae bacterium]|nr:immunity 52 family protein [Nocardioidaceae bacterium]